MKDEEDGLTTSFSIMAVNDEYPTEQLNALSGIIVHVSPSPPTHFYKS